METICSETWRVRLVKVRLQGSPSACFEEFTLNSTTSSSFSVNCAATVNVLIACGCKPLASQTRKIVPFLTPTALAMLPPQHWVAMASDSNVGRLTLNITLDLLGIDRNSQTNEPRIISANKDFEVIRSVCDGIACRQRQLNVITKLSIRGIPQAYV